MMMQGQSNRIGKKLNIMRLCSDRFFSARIRGKYVGMRNRFPAMPQMVFGDKASRAFSFRLNMLLSFPIRVMERHSLFRTDIHTSFHRTASAPVFSSISSHLFSDSPRQGFGRKRVARNSLAAHGVMRASFRQGYAPAVLQGGQREELTRFAGESRHKRFFASLTEKYIRLVHRTFVDQISKRQGILRKQLERRHETPVSAFLPGTAGIHATSGRGRKSLTEKAREYIFRGTDKIGREIDELKRTVKKTEERVRENVAHQVREIMNERNRQVDVGGLTLQVYRNMERMIRSERERRGM